MRFEISVTKLGSLTVVKVLPMHDQRWYCKCCKYTSRVLLVKVLPMHALVKHHVIRCVRVRRKALDELWQRTLHNVRKGVTFRDIPRVGLFLEGRGRGKFICSIF